MKFWGLIFALLAFTGFGAAQSLNCNLQDYKSIDGIKVVASADSVELTWEGEAGAQLRAAFTLRDGQPVVKELAARKGDGEWIVLGKDLTPQFEVTTGRRRIDSVELNNLKHYNLTLPRMRRCTSGLCSGMHHWRSQERSVCRVLRGRPAKLRARL